MPPLPKPTFNILLVEDSEGDKRLTEEALRSGRLDVELNWVRDGVEAMAYLRRTGEYGEAERPDLVLLDLNMPRKDGREVLAEVKGDPDLKTIPVVVLTTSSADKDVIESYDLQANAFVSKPVEFQEFMTAVQEIQDFWLTIVHLPSAA